MGTPEPKILLVEDDPNFGDVLKSYLEISNYNVTLATDGQLGWEMFQKTSWDLCILDVMMPRKDGFTLAREIREKDGAVPIIFLTAKAMKEDIIQGLKIGADDYMTKPFTAEELLLRIQAILKRSSKQKHPQEEVKEFAIGDYIFNFPLRTLVFNGDESTVEKLSPKEADLLRMFAMNLNQVLTRSEALTKIWGKDDYFTARSMDVFITKIRKYLHRDPNIEIVNIHGNGFQMKINVPK